MIVWLPDDGEKGGGREREEERERYFSICHASAARGPCLSVQG